MKMLTLHQPWASLIACGVKTIETRSWPTSYRGPLAIHAGKAQPGSFERVGDWVTSMWGDGSWSMVERPSGSLDPVRCVELPLGAVVAVADLVDVVPIIDGSLGWTEDGDTPPAAVVVSWDSSAMLVDTGATGAFPDMTGQLPFGDFAHGRFAWLLDNVRAVEPVPAKGHQGLRDIDPNIGAMVEAAIR